MKLFLPKLLTFAFALSLMTALAYSEKSDSAPKDAPPARETQTSELILRDSLAKAVDAPWQTRWTLQDGPLSSVAQEDDSLSFSLPVAKTRDRVAIARPLPIEKVRGKTIYLSAYIRAENVSSPPNPWNGIKLMLQITTADGNKTYAQANLEVGSFDWKKSGSLTSIPSDATAANVIMGLELVPGNAWFKDLEVKTIIEPPMNEEAVQVKRGPVYKGHPLERLRGAMVKTTITEDSLRTLGEEWNCNLVRWQIGMLDYRKQGLETPNYDTILKDELETLDRNIPICKKYGMYVLVDLHSLAGHTFASVANQDKLVEVWKQLATKYKDNPAVWGYDIVNEPTTKTWREGVPLWHELAERVCKEIRNIDPVKPIIVESEAMAIPSAFATLHPIAVSNIIYSVHVYNPGQFTHNRVWDPQQKVETYPGMIDGRYWDKSQIERDLAPVIEFQKKYGVQIYVGEFSAIRWSPGADKYLSDVIDVFEKYGWDWTYHAFREWHGWSVEHDSDPEHVEPASTPTDREKLLRTWFSKNQKPSWP